MQMLSLQDASQAVRLSEVSLRRAVKAGQLVAVKVRGRYRISESDLRDWLSGNSTRAAAVPNTEVADATRR